MVVTEVSQNTQIRFLDINLKTKNSNNADKRPVDYYGEATLILQQLTNSFGKSIFPQANLTSNQITINDYTKALGYAVLPILIKEVYFKVTQSASNSNSTFVCIPSYSSKGTFINTSEGFTIALGAIQSNSVLLPFAIPSSSSEDQNISISFYFVKIALSYIDEKGTNRIASPNNIISVLNNLSSTSTTDFQCFINFYTSRNPSTPSFLFLSSTTEGNFLSEPTNNNNGDLGNYIGSFRTDWSPPVSLAENTLNQPFKYRPYNGKTNKLNILAGSFSN